MIGIIFLVQIFTILIPALNVALTKTTWRFVAALMAVENRSYESEQAGMNRAT
jgi:hypothetical protein